MTTPNPRDDVEYRLDAEHIRGICQAWRPEYPVNVTHVDDPSCLYVAVPYRYVAVDHLRQVGYLAEAPLGSDQLVVTGWSTTRLAARGAALTGILARWRDTQSDTAARAVDTYALDGHEWFTDAGRNHAVREATHLLQYETEVITGPHVAYDPRIRPHDDDQARLIDRNRRLEQAIADHITQAECIAGYAVQAYIDDPHARDEPDNARARAITSAMGRYSADIRREYADRHAAPQPPSGPAIRDHPAAIAADDQPTDLKPPAQTTSPSTSGDTTSVAPPPPRGRTP